jgi:hypothetical protein
VVSLAAYLAGIGQAEAARDLARALGICSIPCQMVAEPC